MGRWVWNLRDCHQRPKFTCSYSTYTTVYIMLVLSQYLLHKNLWSCWVNHGNDSQLIKRCVHVHRSHSRPQITQTSKVGNCVWLYLVVIIPIRGVWYISSMISSCFNDVEADFIMYVPQFERLCIDFLQAINTNKIIALMTCRSVVDLTAHAYCSLRCKLPN